MRFYLRLAALSLCLAACAASSQAAPAAVPGPKRVAITIDDLPFVNTAHLSLAQQQAGTRSILSALASHHALAIGFVNEDKLLVKGEVDARIGMLNDWLDAGQALGNHSFGHVAFHGTPVGQYEEAVIRGDSVTRWLMDQHGKAPKYYRFPYNQTGDDVASQTAFEAFLHTHGYTVAPTTMENDDFIYASVYEDDMQSGKREEAERVRAEYRKQFGRALDVYETMTQELFGRQIPQVLCIHASMLNADTLSLLLDDMAQRGYRFVSLDEALQDPAYAMPAGPSGKYGLSWIARWARAAKHHLSVYGADDPPAWIADHAPVQPKSAS